MELATFITESITGIVKGVAAAQLELKGSGGAIVPQLETAPHRPDATAVNFGGMFGYAYDVEFDVAVVISAEREAGAKASISVLGLDLLGASGMSASTQSRTSRIRFKVPVMFPAQVSEKGPPANPYSGFVTA